jgi:hypothetical protein
MIDRNQNQPDPLDDLLDRALATYTPPLPPSGWEDRLPSSVAASTSGSTLALGPILRPCSVGNPGGLSVPRSHTSRPPEPRHQPDPCSFAQRSHPAHPPAGRSPSYRTCSFASLHGGLTPYSAPSHGATRVNCPTAGQSPGGCRFSCPCRRGTGQAPCDSTPSVRSTGD